MQYRKDRKGNELSILGYGCMRFTKKGAGIDIDKAEKELEEAEEILGDFVVYPSLFVKTDDGALHAVARGYAPYAEVKAKIEAALSCSGPACTAAEAGVSANDHVFGGNAHQITHQRLHFGQTVQNTVVAAVQTGGGQIVLGRENIRRSSVIIEAHKI